MGPPQAGFPSTCHSPASEEVGTRVGASETAAPTWGLLESWREARAESVVLPVAWGEGLGQAARGPPRVPGEGSKVMGYAGCCIYDPTRKGTSLA